MSYAEEHCTVPVPLYLNLKNNDFDKDVLAALKGAACKVFNLVI